MRDDVKVIVAEQPGEIGKAKAGEIARLVESFFAVPENAVGFEQWLKERNKKKSSAVIEVSDDG